MAAQRTGASPRRLYDQIGEFLVAQRLDPDPANYAFAHAILAHPNGPLAKAVSALTDGGIRLTAREIESLGHDVVVNPARDRERADGLVAQTQLQVDGFADMVQELRAETEGFGRELAEGAERIRRVDATDGAAALDQVAEITGAMLQRVRAAEAQLEQATHEAADLRVKLDEARENARRDPLTGLANRRAFEESYAEQASAGATMWLAVCDVDHFKQVNDRFGHAVGDRVLKAIAAALVEACAGATVARYGGEEFVVLFRDVDAGTARATLEAARATVAAKRYKLRETDEALGEVTFSAGLAPARAGESVRQSFQRADALLYRAKSEGRNCVRVD